MAKLLIQTQVLENYGAHAWNGEGECPQNWKAKGGEDYVLRDIAPIWAGLISHGGALGGGLSGGMSALQALVEGLKPQVESNDRYYRETVVSWEVLADDQLTPWEANQLQFDGRVKYPAKVLTWPVAA